MSSSTVSMNDGISTTNTLAKKWFLLLNVIIIWLSMVPIAYSAILIYWPMIRSQTPITIEMYFYTPALILAFWAWWVVMVAFVTKIFLIIINIIHKPKEGVFDRTPENKDYLFWSLRGTLMKPAIWAANSFPLPWIDVVPFILFGLKLKSIGTTLMDSWISPEFIELGKNCLIGSTSVLLSSTIIGDKLIIQKIKVGDNVVIGGSCLVSPGTIIEDNVMLGARSTTKIGQVLEEGWIYFGNPCTQLKRNKLADNLNYKATKVGFSEDKDKEQYLVEASMADDGLKVEEKSNENEDNSSKK